MCSGIWTWMTSAPQSASWRAAVGPARTWVMSMTRKRASAWEAGMWGMPSRLLRDAADSHHRTRQIGASRYRDTAREGAGIGSDQRGCAGRRAEAREHVEGAGGIADDDRGDA